MGLFSPMPSDSFGWPASVAISLGYRAHADTQALSTVPSWAPKSPPVCLLFSPPYACLILTSGLLVLFRGRNREGTCPHHPRGEALRLLFLSMLLSSLLSYVTPSFITT